MKADPFNLPSNERLFSLLREEWHAIVTRRREARRRQQIEAVERWKKAFEQLREEQDHLVMTHAHTAVEGRDEIIVKRVKISFWP